MDGSKAHCHDQTARTTMGATVIRTSASEGDFVKVRACAIGFFFFAGFKIKLNSKNYDYHKKLRNYENFF